ncbi:hypothetical protein BGZ63DRAFT_401194 [Mariannaea sp. PMI_226]|nr:hypothetical protein BGZ63DRAFT_401194 [Mariannaea sp. PMI_226]
MPSPSQTNGHSPLPCPSWVYSNHSDTHVAKDRSWFGDDYLHFESFFDDMMGFASHVVGVGTVVLPVETQPTATGLARHGTLRLEKVLHCPDSLCNIIGNPIHDSHIVVIGPFGTHGGEVLDPSTRLPVAYFTRASEEVSLPQLKLSEPPIGPVVGLSPFRSSRAYMIHAFWPSSERARFAALEHHARPRTQ